MWRPSFLILLLVSIASAQPIQSPCPARTFHSELRDAVLKEDVSRLALLVSYPLRINDERGSYYIHDAASLEGRYREIFTSKVRAAILRQQFGSDDCENHTLIYGDGDVIAALGELGYQIEAVNTFSKRSRPAQVPQVRFVCRTKSERMVVERIQDGTLRLRIWNTGNLLTEKPDLDVSKGDEKLEGTRPCTHSIWIFQSGSTEITLSEGTACYPDSNLPPPGAIGQLSRETKGREGEYPWCF